MSHHDEGLQADADQETRNATELTESAELTDEDLRAVAGGAEAIGQGPSAPVTRVPMDRTNS